MPNSLPLWATDAQTQRIEKILQQAGFISVAFSTDEDDRDLTITAVRYRRTHSETAAAPEQLGSAVERFKQWARRADPGVDAFNE